MSLRPPDITTEIWKLDLKGEIILCYRFNHPPYRVCVEMPSESPSSPTYEAIGGKKYTNRDHALVEVKRLLDSQVEIQFEVVSNERKRNGW